MKDLQILRLVIISCFAAMAASYLAIAHTQQSSGPAQHLSCSERKAKSEVVIYTTPTCPYCTRAKNLLRKNCVKFQEIDVSNDPEKRALMAKRAGGKTSVPQIFINNILIGGSTDLVDLKESGKLADMYGLKCCKS